MKKLLLTLVAVLALSTAVYANAQSDYQAGKKAYEGKNYEQALTYYNSAIKANSKFADAPTTVKAKRKLNYKNMMML